MAQLTLTPKPHNNHYLFSDYYLNNRVKALREWRETDVRAAFDALARLWRDRGPALTRANESQTEELWIRPVLEALGHAFAVQVSLRTPGGSKTPDYILCPDDRACARIMRLRGPAGEADLAGALAVADAKAWDAPLDRALKAGGISTLHEHPGLQIDYYIRHSGLTWGVLTNGRLWRLYHKDSSKKLDVFYEVDLPALLEAGSLEDFKYFWLFFRRQAFAAGSFEPGRPAWLEVVLSESQSYERGVSESLKTQVYDALQALAQGFLDYEPNQLTPDDATIAAIHNNGLIVLYRLLFILYAEDRDLLPIHSNEVYRERYSLHALKRRIALDIDHGQPAAPNMAGLWQQLLDLWRAIDRGDDYLGIPAYNGGLFKPDNYPFLEQYRVGDLHLRRAIDLLARVHDQGRAEFIDYRDLEIRHLGSVYEGLLEYSLRVAEEPLVVVKEDGREVYRPAGKQTPDVRPGQVYLVTDKGERKATGSYYTPDYIVQYIVEHTVGPVLAEAAAPYLDEAGGVTDPAGLERAVLAINVLDPAMGSGHFLVAAADFIARFLVEHGVRAGLAEAGEPGDAASDLAYWRRRVAQACIYGVDLGPLAVELAKLSLWLMTVSKDKPLSFLDHHLRCGNSLIGARVADLPLQGKPRKKQSRRRRRQEEAARAAGQLSLLDDSAFAGAMRTATGMMGLIEGLSSDTLADVHRAEKVYRDSVRKVTERVRLVADLWTARHFGLDIPDDQWQGLVNYLLHGGFAMPGWDELIEQGRAIARQRRFFHWELEFPEVFFDEHGRLQGEDAGFDAVIGNPPYVRSIRLKEQDEAAWKFYANHYQTASKGEFDIYLCMIELGLTIVNGRGEIGLIVPNKWFTTKVGRSLRKLLIEKNAIRLIVDFGAFQIFEQATTYTCLLFLSGKKQSDFEVWVLKDARKEEKPLPQVIGKWGFGKKSIDGLSDDPWDFSFGLEGHVLMHLRNYPPLSLIADIFAGTGTRADNIFLMQRYGGKYFSRALDEFVEVEDEVMHPALTGKNIERYFFEGGNFLLFPYEFSENEAILIPPEKMRTKFPKAWQYLNNSKIQAILRARDRGKYLSRDDWYGYGRPQNMLLLREKKIVFPDIANSACFSLDAKGIYIIDTCYAIRIKPQSNFSLQALIALLNSNILTFFLQQTGTDLRGGYFRMKVVVQV